MTIPDSGVAISADGRPRCWWCVGDQLYESYHDLEWGRPFADDRRIFEKICLEGFQSGLSWLTILRKRENFRRAFKNFDIETVARFNSRSVERLLLDAGIVRNQAKIEAAINNARRSRSLIDEFGSLASYVWSFEPAGGSQGGQLDRQTLMDRGTNDEAVAMSKDLKSRGWAFVGPTTLFSVMESIGMVNNHMSACPIRDEVELELRAFERPS